jgi:hypothetical protein
MWSFLFFLEDFLCIYFFLPLFLTFDLPRTNADCCLWAVRFFFVLFDYLDSSIELLLMINTNGLVAQQVHAHFGFGPLCAYLSINYLDRFLSAYELPVSWNQAIMALLFGISLAILYVFTGVLRLIPFWFHLV